MHAPLESGLYRRLAMLLPGTRVAATTSSSGCIKEDLPRECWSFRAPMMRGFFNTHSVLVLPIYHAKHNMDAQCAGSLSQRTEPGQGGYFTQPAPWPLDPHFSR